MAAILCTSTDLRLLSLLAISGVQTQSTIYSNDGYELLPYKSRSVDVSVSVFEEMHPAKSAQKDFGSHRDSLMKRRGKGKRERY